MIVVVKQGIHAEISIIADKIRADTKASKIESEWKFAAMVGDLVEIHIQIKFFHS